MKDTVYFRQADLLVQALPFVHAETCFALKGGTAINFFVRDFPRLSVDIDLVYLPVESRQDTLNGIDAALQFTLLGMGVCRTTFRRGHRGV